ncbi:regulator of G-protein signaling 1 [Salmo salar]|uniref:Regulator of G-protein signaling 1 n=1 Tax=Salmo salar TaxID=8030 RepID=A0A1S3PAA9_SALSA|nr:regulator of G-protein signaling 1 [Salmo salar]|eukprot:XP_014024548.1 PREDICTED: regulator of G-protein signaling 1-like [Salmo salar]
MLVKDTIGLVITFQVGFINYKKINVDHHIHEKINRYMKAPGLCCFDEAVRHVYKLMESDSYSRFLRSDAYLGLRRKARTFWSTLGVKSP